MRSKDGSIRGSVKLIENIKSKKKNKKGKGSDPSEWTWSEISSLVKYSKVSSFTELSLILLLMSIGMSEFDHSHKSTSGDYTSI